MKSGLALNYKSEVVTDKVPVHEKFAYGIGDFGCNMIYANVAAFLTFFYTDIVGLSGAIIGSIILFSRVFDGVSDVIMGTLVDRTHSHRGKTRPWIAASALPLGLGVILIFTKPFFGISGNAIYLMVVYNFTMAISYTMYAIPHGTLAALMTQDQYERSLLNINRIVLGTLGALSINLVTMPLVGYFGGDAAAWTKLNVIYGVIAAGLIFTSYLFTRERVVSSREVSRDVPFKQGVRALFQNKYWRLVLMLGITTYGIMASTGITIYYVKYILGNANLMGTVMLFHFVSSMIGMVAMAPIVKKHGKRFTVFGGFVIFLVGTAIILLSPYQLHYVYVGVFVKGLGFAPLVGLLPSFIADTIEYGEYKTGIRNEGLVYSSESFGQKFGNGLFTAMLGWMLTLSGYVGAAAVQTPEALRAILFLFTYLPAILYGLSVFILAFYKLDREYPEILERLKEKHALNS